jgi:DNA polymerase III subunit epsilon
MEFVALDFETANADLSSACQVGAVVFKDGMPVDTFASLIDPDDFFDPMNVSIHGIDEDAVRGSPKFASVHRDLWRLISNKVVACHSLFDRAVLRQTEHRNALHCIECTWLDVTRVVRRTWPKYAHAGYGLGNLTQDFGIAFEHHNAAEDARATGTILVRAIRETGLTLDEWLLRIEQPITPRAPLDRDPLAGDGDPQGPLHGEVVVFTGALSITRHEAAEIAAGAGCAVNEGITKHTTILIVGDQDVTRLAPGQMKSSKHLKAEALIGKGQPIRILRETDFRALCYTDAPLEHVQSV